MKKKRIILSIIFSLIILGSNAQETTNVRFLGLKIFVSNLDRAVEFYQSTLGFDVVYKDKNQIELKTNGWPIFLELVADKAIEGYPAYIRTGLSLQTFKLLPQINKLKKQGVNFYDSLLNRNGVGIAIPFEDPFGNVINLMEIQVRDVSPFFGLQVYNSGVTISNMEAAVRFYEGILGFEELSRAYLPDALPLKHSDGSFAFMIHYKGSLIKNPNIHGLNSQVTLIMMASDLEKIKTKFRKESIKFKIEEKKIIFQDPEGNNLEIYGEPTKKF